MEDRAMTRSARVLLFVWMACLAIAVDAAQAQPAAPGQSEGPYYVEFVGAGTFGHHVSGSLGGELDYHLSDSFDVFFETGHMFNVTTRDIEGRAARVAAFVNGGATTKQRANYFDFGIKYRFPVFGSGFFTTWTPYIGLGGAVARVTNRTTFEVNGVDVTGQLADVYGVELGNDLTDTLTKGFFIITLGAQRSLFSRCL